MYGNIDTTINHTRISENDILTCYSQEELMEYFGIPLDSSTLANPYREDRNPTCNLTYYKGKLRFNDWSQYYLCATWVNIAGLYYGITSMEEGVYLSLDKYQQILQRVYKELIKDNTYIQKHRKVYTHIPVSNEKPAIYISHRDWNKSDIEFWHPIPPSLLNYYNVIPVSKVWYGDIIQPHLTSTPSSPTYGYRVKDNNQWVIYRPFDKAHKWKKNIPINTILGYDTNDITLYDEPKILCSGLKDCLTVRLATGLETYSYQSEIFTPEKLENNTVLILLDNDATGINQMINLSEKFNIPYLVLQDRWERNHKYRAKDAFAIAKKYGIQELKYQICQILK